MPAALLPAALTGAICLAGLVACAASGGPVAPLNNAQARAFAETHLMPDENLQPFVFSGVVGRSESVIALVENDGQLSAFLVDVSVEGGRRVELPALHENWTFDALQEVLFEDVDSDGATELLVVATYVTGLGPEAGQLFPSVSILDWTSDGVVRRRDIEELAMLGRMDGATDGATDGAPDAPDDSIAR
jgi:hypothetical protein